MKVIFLHIPKTAGQSVHAALVHAFGREAVCPARVNDHLKKFTITELNRYQVFSGHLDWAMLDCIKGPRYTFTIFREPMDRILSFYFYLRDEAAKLSAEDLRSPERQGLRAALELSPKDYFIGGPPFLRRFIDDHYDNFYSYYFAGRHYQARSELVGLTKRGELSHDDILRMAKDNLSQLDSVFTVDDMTSVFSAIREISGKEIMSDDKYRVNVNKNISAHDRGQRLRDLGAERDTMEKLEACCMLDSQLWQLHASKVI